MAEHKKIPITDSEPPVVPSRNGVAPASSDAEATAEQPASNSANNNARRSPVTDLLFDSAPSRQQNSAERLRAVYHISIVAEMVETHPQTLRMYERMGLINPQRTRNNVRLYSEADVEQVRRIQHLTQDLGVNLAGVEVVFKLLRELHRLREEMEAELEDRQRDSNQS